MFLNIYYSTLGDVSCSTFKKHICMYIQTWQSSHPSFSLATQKQFCLCRNILILINDLMVKCVISTSPCYLVFLMYSEQVHSQRCRKKNSPPLAGLEPGSCGIGIRDYSIHYNTRTTTSKNKCWLLLNVTASLGISSS